MRAEVPLSGNLEDYSLPEILVYLNQKQKTGTLVLSNPPAEKKIYFKNGDAIFASSNYDDDRLGEMLLKAGTITLEQYDKSVEMLKQTGKRQGAILVELGSLTPKDLFAGVKYQVREIIYSLFMWEKGLFNFIEAPLLAEEVITLKMSMGNLIYEGIGRIDNWTRIRGEMPPTESVLKLNDDPLCLFQDVGLKGHDMTILSLVDGKTTIKEIMENSGLSSFNALKALYVLYSLGILVLKEGRAEEPVDMSMEEILRSETPEEKAFIEKVDSLYIDIDNKTHYELLGVDDTADSNTVKKAYYRLAKEYHPDRHHSTTDADLKEKLTAIFDRLSKAYDILKDDKNREEYERSFLRKDVAAIVSADAERAEEQYKRGIEEFKKGDYWSAADLFRWATRLAPDKARYWSYLSLSLSKMPNRLKEAEETLLKAIELEPHKAEHYANLGLLYLKAGMKKRAKSQFEKALRWDPKNQKALQGLSQIPEPEEQ